MVIAKLGEKLYRICLAELKVSHHKVLISIKGDFDLQNLQHFGCCLSLHCHLIS